jgi:hypothetical protein
MVTSGKCRLTLCGCRTKLYQRREGANFHETIQGNEPYLIQRLEPDKENVDDYSTR